MPIRVFCYYLFSFIFLSCNHPKKSKKMITDSFKYSVYRWRKTDSMGQPTIQIEQYIEIDTNDSVIAFQKNWNQNAKYYRGKIDETTKELINSSLFDQVYDSIYTNKGLEIYDGPAYVMDYYIINAKRQRIMFEPEYLPAKLSALYKNLDSFIQKTNDKDAPFDLTVYQNELSNFDIINHPIPIIQKAKIKLRLNYKFN